MDRETIEAMERDYCLGFNNGYTLTEHLPDLARQLSHESLEAPWFEGFRDGRAQYMREQVREMRPSWLRDDRHAEAPPERIVPSPRRDRENDAQPSGEDRGARRDNDPER